MFFLCGRELVEEHSLRLGSREKRLEYFRYVECTTSTNKCYLVVLCYLKVGRETTENDKSSSKT